MDITRRGTFAATLASAAALSACSATTVETADTVATPAAFAAWLDGYKAAWEGRDAMQAGALFTEDASYHEMPFDEAMVGRAAIEAYWTRVTAAQSNISFNYDVIACVGDQGIAHWRAALNVGADTIELDGVFVCTFADAEHVRALREWWHVKASPTAAPG